MARAGFLGAWHPPTRIPWGENACVINDTNVWRFDITPLHQNQKVTEGDLVYLEDPILNLSRHKCHISLTWNVLIVTSLPILTRS